MGTSQLVCATLLLATLPVTLAFSPSLYLNTSFTDLDGWWNFGPRPSSWIVRELAPLGITTEGPSWHSTNSSIITTGTPAVANLAVYASWARINISVDDTPTTLQLTIDRQIQGPLLPWSTTTNTTGNWTLNLGPSPIADIYNATLTVSNGSATIYSVEQTIGIQTQQTNLTQLFLYTVPILNATNLNPLYTWSGDWKLSPFADPFSGTVQTAVGGPSSSVAIPIPANTSFVLMQGVRGPANADGLVEFDPPAPCGKTVRFWSHGDTPNGMTLFSTPIDPTVLYSMTVRAGGGSIGLYHTQYISGLLDNSNWPVLNRTTPSATTTTSSQASSTSSTSSPSSNSLSATNLGGLIGGLVAGITAVVAVIIITILYRRNNRRSSKPVALDTVDLADIRDEDAHLTPFTQGYSDNLMTTTRREPPSTDPSGKGANSTTYNSSDETPGPTGSDHSRRESSHLPASSPDALASLQEEDSEDVALRQAAPPRYNTEWRERQLAGLASDPAARGLDVTPTPAQLPPSAVAKGDDPRYVRGWV